MLYVHFGWIALNLLRSNGIFGYISTQKIQQQKNEEKNNNNTRQNETNNFFH